jgi:hypothetical protein
LVKCVVICKGEAREPRYQRLEVKLVPVSGYAVDLVEFAGTASWWCDTGDGSRALGVADQCAWPEREQGGGESSFMDSLFPIGI